MFKTNQFNIQIMSQNWQQALGQYCRTCKIRLRSQECISVCGCLLFCHEDCFIKQISQSLTTRSIVKCLRCDQIVSFSMKQTIFWVCNKKPSFIFSVIGGILMLIAMYSFVWQGVYRKFMADGAAYSIITAGALAFLLAIRKASRLKVVKLQDIKVVDTKMLGKNETEKGLLSKQSIKPLEGMGGMSMNKLNKTEMGEYEMM